MKWETLSSEYLIKHKYFVTRKDVCRTPDGKIVDPYYVVELPVSATALALTEDGQVILVRQYRHPVGEVMYETPGGFVDAGEDAETGMKRELMEETGYAFSKVEWLGRMAANPALLNNYTDLYLATGGKKVAAQHLDDNEQIDIVLLSMEELLELLRRNEIKQALHLSCIHYALLKLGVMTITRK
ncbi:MAG: NUDIX hydrolase [Bacteroidetes bacterium]|nr:NUDIX hydrolase [Bacteroidota bacterium]